AQAHALGKIVRIPDVIRGIRLEKARVRVVQVGSQDEQADDQRNGEERPEERAGKGHYRSAGRGFRAPSANRDGRSGVTSRVLALPSEMISPISCPSAGACITPCPEDPLIK